MMRSRLRMFMAPATLLLFFAASCGPRVSSDPGVHGYAGGPRKESWAQPLDLPGVPNFHRVTVDLYRSAQPTAEGMCNLEQFGIRTIINLRSLHSDAEETRQTSLARVQIPMHAWRPEEEDIIEFLKVATSRVRTPVLVHCNYGADRTGFMCALYRIVVCGWSKEEALVEMVEGGFGFHMMWKNLVEYIENIDIEALRGKASPKHTSPSTRVQQGKMAPANVEYRGARRARVTP